MKTLFSIACFCLTLSLSAQQFETDNPGEYSEYIVTEQNALAQKMIELTQLAANTDDVSAVHAKRMEIIKQLETSLEKFKNMAPFGGKSDYRDEIIKLYESYHSLYVKDYAELTALMQNKNSSMADLKKYMEANNKIDKETSRLEKEVQKSQKKFAEEHNMTLTENELAGKMQRIAEASDYTNSIFMEYLNVAVINERFLNAMAAKDIAAMKKARAELLKQSPTAVRKMNSITAYKGNARMKKAGEDLAEYYEKMANNEYLEIIEFFEMAEKEPTTQEEVDKYNKGVNRFNDIIGKLNVDQAKKVDELNASNKAIMNKALAE